MMNNKPYTEEITKPYEFVPFARRVRRQDVLGHDRLDLEKHYTGRLIFQLRALRPVFVGTGSYALGNDVGFPSEKVIRPFYRVAGVPTIPGSSLKGVARSIAEAVSPSCVTVSRADPDQLPEGVELTQSRENKCGATKACPACSIFGHSGRSRDARANHLGKASFGDAPLVSKSKMQLFRLASLYAPRASQSPPIYLNEARDFKGRKFYYHSRPVEDEHQPPVEVIPPGGVVQAQVSFENLAAAELGLLCFALGIDGALTLKLGGGKPLGLGSLRVINAQVFVLGANHYTQAESQETIYEGKERDAFVGEAVDAALAGNVLLREQALALTKILSVDESRMAPEGMY